MQSTKALPMKVNTNIGNLRSEDQFILACLQNQQSLPELDLDEDLLMHRMKYHRVTSMVYQHLLQIDGLHILSAKTQASLKEHYQLNIGRNLAISYLVKQISKALAENNIETMTLKGAMFIESFPDYALVREMSDLDIMVKPHKLYQALEVLYGIGFEYTENFRAKNKIKKWYYLNRANAIPIQSKQSSIFNILVEVHWQLFSALNHTSWPEKDLWFRANYSTKLGIYSLEAIDTLLHLCAHQCNDLKIHLYGLVDVDKLVSFWGKRIDWTEVIYRAKSRKVLLHLFNILRLSHELLNTPLPDEYFTLCQSLELKSQSGYNFLRERLFQKEYLESGLEPISILNVFRRLEYSNLWQRLEGEIKLLIPQAVRLSLSYPIGRHLP